MSRLEQELMGKISRLDEDKQRQVLAFAETITLRFYTLDELSVMTPEERQKAVAAFYQPQQTD